MKHNEKLVKELEGLLDIAAYKKRLIADAYGIWTTSLILTIAANDSAFDAVPAHRRRSQHSAKRRVNTSKFQRGWHNWKKISAAAENPRIAA